MMTMIQYQGSLTLAPDVVAWVVRLLILVAAVICGNFAAELQQRQQQPHTQFPNIFQQIYEDQIYEEADSYLCMGQICST